MTAKRFTIIDGIKKGTHSGIRDNQKQNNQRIGDELWLGEVVAMLNEGVMIVKENEQLKQQRIDLLRLIDNNIEIYENINTNVEFHKGEIQGKLTLLYNLRELILK